MTTEPLRGGAGRKPKFQMGQVVCSERRDVPVKIRDIKTMSGGQHGDYFVYVTDGFDYFGDELRPLTQREKGKP